MKILALETSSDACSIALMTDDAIEQKHEIVPKQHASIILNWVEALLEKTNLNLSSLDGITYSCGPGSFTGIRVSAAVGQGLALAAQKPLIAVPSLQGIAQGIFRELGYEKVMVLLDARVGQVYCGYYILSSENIMTAAKSDVLCPLNNIDLALINNNEWILLTDLEQETQPMFKNFADVKTDYYPQARDIATLAKSYITHGKITSLEEALPIYLREEDAWKKT